MSKDKKFSSVLGVTVGMGILSWKSHKTLEKSLQSYEKVGLKDFFDEVKIVFQEVSEEDKELAKKYGYEYVGINKNLGIQNGHTLIAENLSTDYVLVLENDNPLVEDKDTVYARLAKALSLLQDNKIDIMRLRHRWEFGEGFCLEKYTNMFDVQNLHEKYSYDTTIVNSTFTQSLYKFFKRSLRPLKAMRVAGYSLYFEKEPHKVFPKYIDKLEEELFCINSYIMTWTNQSVLLKLELYKKLLKYAQENPSSRTANGFQDFEKPLNSMWWRKQNYKIGLGEGIFTHNRFDDSWRESHHAFNTTISSISKGK